MRLFVAAVLVASLSHAAEPLKCPDGPSKLVIANGEYAARPGVVYGLQGFLSNQVPRGKKMPACLAKITDIERGRIVVSGDSLTNLFDQKMSKSKKQSISDLKVQTSGNHVIITGKARKVILISFEIKGPVDAVGGRAIRLQAEKIKAGGLPIKGLLEMVGMELGSLINSQAARGVTVQENSILFEPEKLANVRGHIIKVQVAGEGLVVDFGQPRKQAQAKPSRRGQ